MRQLKSVIDHIGSWPAWIVGVLLASLAASRASQQFVLAWLCLGAASILLISKIIHSSLRHEHLGKWRAWLAVAGTVGVIAGAAAIGWGIPPAVPSIYQDASPAPESSSSSPGPSPDGAPKPTQQPTTGPVT